MLRIEHATAALTEVSLLTGLALEVDAVIDAYSELQIDLVHDADGRLALQFPIRSSLSALDLSVDGALLQDLDVSAAADGSSVAALLNQNAAFVAAGLQAQWQDDVLSIASMSDTATTALANSSLQTGLSVDVDEFVFVDDARGLGVWIDTAAGLTVTGLAADETGGFIEVNSPGNIEVMGNLLAGGLKRITFGAAGQIQSQEIVYSATQDSYVTIESEEQVFIGGTSMNLQGERVEVGGYIRANDQVNLIGRSHPSGNAVYVQGSSEIITYNEGSLIRIESDQDANIQGLLLAGGEVTNRYDVDGFYQGRSVAQFSQDAEIIVVAANQLRVGGELYAASLIDLFGGSDPVEVLPRDF